ncbi:twin-arginine translocase TatA/TatE family subunit [Pseudomonas sp. WN033]|nr:twin-arginine translocase TatA/TatE family subunit [Pseudomonas sp. WN033]
MGFGGISLWQLLIILLIVVLLFGTKRLKGIGSDLGEAIKGFRKSVNQDDEKTPSDSIEKKDADTIDVTAEKKQDSQSKD